ncbi:hypothetical protein C2869_05950 [Saccharobesus litoralis]|uniref:Uncharacterized protein n=1 Tax=Saccharobesus litoralis TaxID=2172099 RepID=A0A2S0VP73_9ALTE|nr:hypothetical protein C2869_05950 [Saccharobesus litoralis]
MQKPQSTLNLRDFSKLISNENEANWLKVFLGEVFLGGCLVIFSTQYALFEGEHQPRKAFTSFI